MIDPKLLRDDILFLRRPKRPLIPPSTAIEKFMAAWASMLKVAMGVTGKGYRKVKQYGTGKEQKMLEGSGRKQRRQRTRVRDRDGMKLSGSPHAWSAYFDGTRPRTRKERRKQGRMVI